MRPVPVHQPFEERDWLDLDVDDRFEAVGIGRIRCQLCGRVVSDKARTNHERGHLLEHLAMMAARPPEIPPRKFLRPRPRVQPRQASAGPLGDWCWLDVLVVAATTKALLVRPYNEHGPSPGGESWIPRQFVHNGKGYDRDDRDLMLVERWIAAERGWL